MEWSKPNVFDAKNTAPWVSTWGTPREPQVPVKPDFADNEELKKAYGLALGQGLDAFNAAMKVFNEELPKALWASLNWIRDPIVIATRDVYIQTLKKSTPALDKEELLAEVLESARIAPEFKDKASLLKLYSEIAGYTGKISVDASTNNIQNNNTNFAQIVLVKGNEPIKTISPDKTDNNSKSKIHNNALPALKLVSGGS